MIPVIDDRLGDEVSLCSVGFGDTFIWNEYLCQRVNPTGIDFDLKPDHLLCITIGSGQMVQIGRLANVTPCKCEITITE